MRAVAEHVEEAARRMGDRAFRVSGLREGTWIVMDYVDVVVHLFDPQQRRYYELELLWGDAPRVPWRKRARRKGETAKP
jgi:ribosome-associated protein